MSFFKFLLVLLACVYFSGAQASDACVTADPKSVDQVFECIATATVNKYNNANPFTNMQKVQCNQIKTIYTSVLAQNGLGRNREELAQKLPSCEVFSDVLFELNGERPFWHQCLNYDGTTQHMVTCLTSLSEYGKAKNQRQQQQQAQMLANCALAQRSYEFILLTLSDEIATFGSPSNYKKIDCDDYLSALKGADPSTEAIPCADFDANNVAGHAKKCLLADKRLTQSNVALSCPILRQKYQSNLVEVYGQVPDGFRLLSCSVLNPIADEITQLRQK